MCQSTEKLCLSEAFTSHRRKIAFFTQIAYLCFLRRQTIKTPILELAWPKSTMNLITLQESQFMVWLWEFLVDIIQQITEVLSFIWYWFLTIWLWELEKLLSSKRSKCCSLYIDCNSRDLLGIFKKQSMCEKNVIYMVPLVKHLHHCENQ